MKAKTFLLGVTAGLIGGLTTAILTAPQSGNDLRGNIVKNARTAKSGFQDLKVQAISVKDSAVQLKNEAKNNIPKIISDLKVAITSYTNEIEPDTTKLKQEIESLQNSITEIENNLNDLNKKQE